VLLTLSLGNTNTFGGLFEGDSLLKTFSFLVSEVELIKKKVKEMPEAIVFCSVVPDLGKRYRQKLKEFFQISPREVKIKKISSFFPIRYKNKEKLGIDRVVNILAALRKNYPPFLVIDVGTAVTFDLVNSRGEFVGGVIAPGLEILREGLNTKTAQLPLIKTSQSHLPPVIGRSTVHCLQSGLAYGFLGMVKEIIRQIKKEFGHSLLTIATGGGGEFVFQHLKEVKKYDPTLILEGLKISYQEFFQKGSKK
jgi:type III pantothenate kinase